MSKIAAGVSKITGIAASILQFIPGGQPFAAAASAISVGSGVIASATAKPPLSVPALDDFSIGSNQPYPYIMGRCLSYGHKIHHEAHGRERQDVPNPWLSETYIYSGAGPIESVDAAYANSNQVTFSAADSGFEQGYYDKYLRADWQVGNTPEASHLNPFENDPTPPVYDYWGSAWKLSGLCAAQFSMLLDDVETHYRSGPPKFSLLVRGVKVYDPRLDDTYAGGSGSHRLGTETTYTYSQNPVLHALTYAYGRYQNGVHVCGGGLPIEAIDIDSFVAAANTADANGWTIGGIVYENGEDGETWNNLKLILKSCGAFPTNDAGVLRCIHHAPRVTIDTITDEDLVGPCATPGMPPFKKGFNSVIPVYRSEANDWSYVPSSEVEVTTLVTSQGEKRTRERKYDLITDANQASALGVYDVYDSVEIEPIELNVGRRFINYSVGDAFDLDIAALGLDLVAYVTQHAVDPETGNVRLTLKTDTTAKHAFALSQTGTAPAHPTLVSNEDLDRAGDIISRDVRGIKEGTVELADVTVTGIGSIRGNTDAQDENIGTALINSSGGNLGVSVKPTSAFGAETTTNDPVVVTTGSISITVVNGSGSEVISWAKISGDTITVDSPTATTTTFSRSCVLGDEFNAIYQVTVTDGGSSVTANVSITIAHYGSFI